MKIINLRCRTPGGDVEFEIAINDSGELFDPWKPGGQLGAGDEVTVEQIYDDAPIERGASRLLKCTATTREQLR